MEIGLLKTFVSLAATCNFSETAKILHMTQSTISHQIARLEEAVGQKLFIRTTRQCQLTKVGEIFLEDAKDILRKVTDIERKFKPQQLAGNIRVGIPDDIYLFRPMSQAIAEFTASHPHVQVDIVASLAESLRGNLESGTVDIAFLRQTRDVALGVHIGSERLVWSGAEECLHTPDLPLRLAFISGPCIYKRTAVKALEEAGLPWRCVMTCTNPEGIKAAAEAGLAISVFNEGDLGVDMPLISEQHGLPPLPSLNIALHYASTTPSSAVVALAELLSSTLRLMLVSAR